MADVTILVRAGQLVPAHDQLAIANGAVAIAGETIEAIGTYDVLWDQFFLGPGKGDEAKKIIKSLCKFDNPFVRYALPSSYCVHYPRLAHSKPPRYLQYTIAELFYGPIAQ